MRGWVGKICILPAAAVSLIKATLTGDRKRPEAYLPAFLVLNEYSNCASAV
jgi:hypothetical protein